MRCHLLRLVVVLAGVLAIACEDNRTQTVTTPTAPGPIVAPTPVVPDRIEFRVLGTATNVVIRHASPVDGLTQVRTDLPYISAMETTRDNLFLSLDASAIGSFGFLQAQIAVNGVVIRDANASGTADPRVSLSVTYRRGQLLEARAR